MKIQVLNYSFNKTSKTVTFSDYSTIRLDSILLVTNVTSNVIIYNFANPLLGGTVLNNVLTLTYDTSSMSNTDKLQIFYDDGNTIPTVDETVLALNEESIWLLRRMVKMLESSTVVDSNMRQRVSVDNTVSVLPSSYSIGSSVSNTPTTGVPVVASTVYYQPVWSGPIDPRWTNIENARISYNTGIRSNLSWT